MHPIKIVVATADMALSKALKVSFDDKGYENFFALDGMETIYLAEKTAAELFIIDSEISKKAGHDLGTLIRKVPKLKHSRIFHLLSEIGYPETESQLNGVSDEYIEKPVNITSLLEKISLQFKPLVKANSRNTIFKKITGNLVIDRETYIVNYKQEQIILPKKEFELLYLLASRPEKVFTRKEIFKNIWGKEISPKAGRTIDVHIRKLRAKLDEQFILTVKGIGYKVVA
jgi:two-component system alkaline phosphatase synthesis response regulator PhoP